MKITKETVMTDEEYDKLLTELDTLRASVVLDPDPINVGLDEINRKLATIQGSRDRVSAIVCDAIINKNLAQRIQNSKQAELERKSSNLSYTSADIKALKSADLRKAGIETMLADLIVQVKDADTDVSKADTLLKCASAVSKDLEIKNDNLNQQTYTIRMIINIHSPVKDEFTK
jgi:hypothetical protein